MKVSYKNRKVLSHQSRDLRYAPPTAAAEPSVFSKFLRSAWGTLATIVLALASASGGTVLLANFGPMVLSIGLPIVAFIAMSVMTAFARGPPVRARLSSEAGVTSSGFIGIFFAVLILVIGIALADPVLDESANILGHANIASFPLVSTVTEFLPVIYIAGLFGLAGGVAFYALKGTRIA